MAITRSFNGMTIRAPGGYMIPRHILPARRLCDFLFKLKVVKERQFFSNIELDHPVFGEKRV